MENFNYNNLITIESNYDFKAISVSFGFSKNGYIKKDGRQSIVYKFYKRRHYVELPSGFYAINKKIDEGTMGLLTKEICRLQTAVNSIPNVNSYSLHEIKLAVTKHQIITASFVDFGKSYINASNRSAGTKYNYNGIFKDMEKFKKDILISEMDYVFGQKYIKWLEKQGKTQSQIAVKVQQIKTILTAAEKHIQLPHSTFHNIEYTNKKSNKKEVYLTKDDIKKLETFKFSKKSLRHIIDIFLLACYCGLRFSDIKTLKSSEIINGWLEKVTQKTKKKVLIPVSKLFDGKFLSLVDKYGSVEKLVSIAHENGAFNNRLKEGLAEANVSSINGKITFHTARHTFATLLLEQGINPVNIQNMLGHSNLNTTMNVYASITKNTIMNDLTKKK